MTAEQEVVGRRIESDEHLATIRYVGPVPPTKGVWLGVEWDDVTRGKHDGSHEGQQHFKTRHPTSGSFIREKKANFGLPCYTALCERYGMVDDTSAGIIEKDMFVVGQGQQITTVEVVGAHKLNKKQSKFDELQEVVLRNMCIYGSAPGEDLSMYAPSITELDLSKNLLSSWHDVAKICSKLKHLHTLHVSENKLRFPDSKDQQCSFSSVRHLYINRMQYNWQQIVQCARMCPNLVSVHACFNDVTSIDGTTVANLNTLELLNLESNKLSGWQEVLKLADLPRLKSLILNDTGIDQLQFPGNFGDKTPAFSSLTSFSISHNNIKNWTEINQLNRLKNLEELKIQFNPITSLQSPATTHELFTAKIERLKLYNRSKVTYGERRGAEIDYLRMFGKAWLAAGGSQDPEKNHPNEEFLRQHPRYQQLVQVYGPPEDSELKEHATNLKATLLEIKIRSPNIPEKSPFVKKLPGSMTVQKLRGLIQRLYKITDTSDLVLKYTSDKMKGPEIDIDNDQRQLSYFAIESGDTIIVKWGPDQ